MADRRRSARHADPAGSVIRTRLGGAMRLNPISLSRIDAQPAAIGRITASA
jgi:hypothetical protein